MLESLRTLVIGCLVGVVLAQALRAQDEDEITLDIGDPTAESAPTLDPDLLRFTSYLERKPYQQTVFEKLVEAAMATNSLDLLVAHYQGLVDQGAGGVPARVVLARLLARDGRGEEAIACLGAIESEDPELQALLGALYLDGGRPIEAALALEKALARSSDAAILERIHAERAEAYLAAGEREQAIAALRALAAIDPASFRLSLSAAGLLAESGLFEPALEEYRRAVELAGDDGARRVRALSEVGRLCERLDRREEALASYEELQASLGHGHWLKRDVMDRVLALHVRTGTLEALASSLAERASKARDDLDLRELHARALEELHDLDGAAALLASATKDFPDDLALGLHRIEVTRKLKDLPAAIAEYQRLIERHPDELDLYLELGALLASDGRLQEARTQWEKTLEKRLADEGLALRIAELHSLYGMHEEAARLIERALELEPSDMRMYGELAGELEKCARSAEIPALLDRAAAAAGEDPARLEDFAAIARRAGAVDRARAALERVLEARPDEARVVYALVELEIASGEKPAALERLLGLLDRSSDATVRRDALARIVRLHAKSSEKLELEALARARGEHDPSSSAAPLICAELAAIGGHKKEAGDLLAAWVAEHDADELALERLAALQAERGQTEEAIATYERLAEIDPRSGTRWLERMAEVRLAANQEEEAFACYEEILRRSPDNSAAFASVARTWKRLGEEERAVRCFEQALRLAPENGEWKLELADLYDREDKGDRASELARQALASSDAGVRDRARAWIYERLVREDRVEQEIVRLREAVARNPYDDALTLTLVDLLVREFENELALDLLDDVLSWRPKEEPLLRERAKLLVEMERWQPAMADYESLWKLPDADRSSLARAMAECALGLGDRSLADRYLVQGSDPVEIAAFYERHGLVHEAIEVLERALATAPDDAVVVQRLSLVLERSGSIGRALELHERTTALEGESTERSLREAELQLALGDTEAAYDTYAAAILCTPLPAEPEFGDRRAKRGALTRARNAYSSELERICSALSSKDREADIVEVAARVLAIRPEDSTLVNRIVGLTYEFTYNGQSRVPVARVLDIVRMVGTASAAKGVAPAGQDAEEWAKILARIEKRLIERDPKLARERIENLAREAETQPLTRERIRELMRSYQGQEMQQELEALFLRAHETFPDDEDYLGGVALFEMQAERWEEAEAHLAALAEISARRRARSDPLEERESDLPRLEKRLRARLPEDLAARLDATTLRTLHRLSQPASLTWSWNAGSTPNAGGVRLAHAVALLELGRSEEARAILATFEPPHEEYVARAAALAALYAEHDLDADAERLRESVWQVTERVEADPLLRHQRSWPEEVRAAVLAVAETRQDEERWTEAYEILRSWAGSAKARRLLRVRRCAESVRSALAERYASERDALGDSPDPETLRRWRRTAVHTIELDVDAGDLDGAIAVATEVLAQGSPDPTFEKTLARLYERAGRTSEAVVLWKAFAEARRSAHAVQFTSSGFEDVDAPPDPHALAPEVEAGKGEFDGVVQYITREGALYRGANPPTALPDPEVDAALAELVRIGLSTRDYELVATTLGEVLERNPQSARMLAWYLRSALESAGSWQFRSRARPADAAVSPLPLARLLEKYAGDDEGIVSWYGELLVEAGDREEATRVYKRYLRKSPQGDDGSIASALRLLQAEEARATFVDSHADLAAAVAADPKNAHLRIAHVRELLEAEQYEEASAQGLETERIATHLPEARSLARTALALCGRDAEYEERLVAELERLTDTRERLAIAGAIAELRWFRGEEDGARAILEAAMRKGSGNETLDPGGWFLRKGRPEIARTFLEQGLARVSTGNPWYVQQYREVLASLPLFEGRIDAVLAYADALLVDYGEEDWNLERVQALTQVLAPALEDEQALRTLHEAIAAREEPIRSLYAAALALGGRDARASEEALAAAGLAHRSTRVLLPAAVGLARERDDFAAALAILERVEPTYHLSGRALVEGPLGPLGERAAFLVERGALHLALDDRAGAEALWREAFPDEERDACARAAIWAENGGWVEASAELSKVSPRVLRDDAATSLLAAAVAYGVGDLERALELLASVPDPELEDADVFWGDMDRPAPASDPRPIRLALLLELGRREEAIDLLKEEVERAPGDITVAQALVELVGQEHGAAGLETLAKAWRGSAETAQHLAAERCRRAGAAGNWGLVTELAGELLDHADDWERREWAGLLAEACMHLDRIDDAGQAIRRSVDDPASAEGYRAAVDYFVARGHWESALDWLEAAELASVDLGELAAKQRCRVHYELWQDAEALAALWECIDSQRAQIDDLPLETAMLLAERTGERARLAEALGQNPTDRALQRHALALAFAVSDWERAIELARGLVERPESALFAAGALSRALEGAGRREEALAACEALLDRLDREQLLDPFETFEERIDTARTQRARLALSVHGVERCAAVCDDALGRRFGSDLDVFQIQTLQYGSYRGNEELWALGLWRAYVERSGRGGPSPWDRPDGRQIEARFRSGEVDEALAEIWELACGPPTAERDPQGSDASVDGALVVRLFGLYLEADRLDELLQRFEVALESGATDDRLVGTYARVLARMERWEDVARVLSAHEARLARADLDVLARASLALGQFEAGLRAIETGNARPSSGRETAAADWRRGFFALPEKGGRTRFAFGESDDGSGVTSWSSSMSSFPDFDRPPAHDSPARIALHAALLRANGRGEEAARLEEPLVRQDQTAPLGGSELVALAEAYADLRADEDAERLLSAHAERGTPEASLAFAKLAEIACEHGDAARLERYTKLWLEHEEQRRPLAEAPERWRRAAWLARVGADPLLVERAVEAARALAATNSFQPSEVERGWIALDTGDIAAATAHFRVAAESGPHRINRVVPDELALQGLALALLRAEGAQAARTLVLRALAEDPSGIFAPRLRRALSE